MVACGNSSILTKLTYAHKYLYTITIIFNKFLKLCKLPLSSLYFYLVTVYIKEYTI